MSRPIAPADLPASAWSHIHALPGLYQQRDALRATLARCPSRSVRNVARRSRLNICIVEALRREAALARLGIQPDQIPALLASPAKPFSETEH